jgi:hypothetical protein
MLFFDLDSINRPYKIVLLVFRGVAVRSAATYPRPKESGNTAKESCF